MAVFPSTATAQIQTQKILAADANQGDRFGQSVDSSGDWIVSSKPQDDEIAEQSGAVYFLRQVNGLWTIVQKCKTLDAEFGDSFGYDVAIDSGTCVGGAKSESPTGIPAAGSCYVLEESGGVWSQTAKIWANDAQPNQFFGWSVDISGDWILVGAREDDQLGAYSGAAYVFERVGTGWVQRAKLAGSDTTASDFFGQAVALHGDFAIVGSRSSIGGTNRGAAYVFQRFGTSWTEVARLSAIDGAAGDSFGSRVAIAQDVACVGATLHDHDFASAGAAFVFERIGGAWLQTQELLCHDPWYSHLFGLDVTIDGELLAVGAVGDGPSIGMNVGAGYLFERRNGLWVEIGKATARDGSDGDSGGSALALRGSTMFFGALADDDACPTSLVCNSGSMYVFEFAPDARQYGHCASGAPCGNTSRHGGCVNSTGVGATLAAAGSSSVAQDELYFEARNLQPGKSAMLFMALGQGQAILGDGLRMVTASGVGFFRYPLRQSGVDGSFFEGPGLVALSQQRFPPQGHLLPGSLWNFQCWYRDAGGPCGQGTNLTNALEVMFTP
jgi:hypothetical protein